MKIYAAEFDMDRLSPWPQKAIAYSSIKDAIQSYSSFIEECNCFGATPLAAWLYRGKPNGDEENTGYPDYPDYIIEPRYWRGNYYPKIVKT